jgi:hypothetical protein
MAVDATSSYASRRDIEVCLSGSYRLYLSRPVEVPAEARFALALSVELEGCRLIVDADAREMRCYLRMRDLPKAGLLIELGIEAVELFFPGATRFILKRARPDFI